MSNDKVVHWTELLKRRLASSTNGLTEEEKKVDETILFTKYYTEWRGGSSRENYKNIPRFYYRLPAEDEVLLQKLREESRILWFLLDNHQVSPMAEEEAMISYDCFLKFGDKAGVKSFFTARVYAKFPHNNPYGRISIIKGQFLIHVAYRLVIHNFKLEP
uniref:Protein phosphatase 2, regulatory subunit B'', gamma n=1 Tax=Hucho hucho TaxID=62062 RepID=A0A4W5QV15_9TELE